MNESAENTALRHMPNVDTASILTTRLEKPADEMDVMKDRLDDIPAPENAKSTAFLASAYFSQSLTRLKVSRSFDNSTFDEFISSFLLLGEGSLRADRFIFDKPYADTAY